MTQRMRFSILPAVAALAAFFMVLPQTDGDATVKMVRAEAGWRFDQREVHIEPGDRIAFTNDSSTTHTATCASCSSDAWDTGDVRPGQTKLLSFDETKSFLFVCRYHGQTSEMNGTIAVGNAPPPTSPSPSAPESGGTT